MCGRGYVFLVVFGVVLGGCASDVVATDAGGDLGERVDSGADVAPGRVAEVSVRDGLASLSLTAGPARLRVARPDGRPWLASPPATPFFELGLVRGGPSATRFHDPRLASPPGVEWRAPSLVVGSTERSITLEEPGAGRVTLGLEPSSGEGEYALSVEASGADVALVRFHLAADDGGYHGLGERFGAVDARGAVVPMQLHVDGRSASGTNEAHVPVPFVVSTRGYGVFVETREAGAFDVAASDPARVTATFEGRAARFHVFVGESPSAVIAAYTRRTGLPRLPPRWVYGPMQWRNVWASQAELFEDARRLRAEGIPTTTLWIDNPWEASYNDHVWDTRRFPDPPGMFRDLARLGFKVLVWSTPYLDAVYGDAAPTNTAEELFLQARDRGWLVRHAEGAPYVSVSNPGSAGGMSNSQGALVDFTSPEASAFWSSRLDPLVALGVRGFKLDYGEDVLPEVIGVRPRLRFASGESERTAHSNYPQRYHGAYRDALARGAMDDGFLLVRASSWGGQRVADVVWPGDLDNDFRPHDDREVGGLPAAVHGMLSLAASGFPNFGSDTGGYRGGRPTREALLRWAEHTALSPVMQLGGGGESHNPWAYDPDAVAIYRSLATLHQDLVPYLRALALRASRDGAPPVRSLALAYPDDLAARADGEAYLLGDDLLVAPVVTPGATARRVHLPAGTWVHWFDGEARVGPADVDVPAPLGRPPLFVRQGALIPLSPEGVVTLSSTDDPSIVDERDRASRVRARVIPAGARAVTLEDDTRLTVDEGEGRLSLGLTPGRDVRSLVAEVDLAHRGRPTTGPVAGVTTERGEALPRASDAASVGTTCTSCWYHDAARGVLRLALEGAVTVTVR